MSRPSLPLSNLGASYICAALLLACVAIGCGGSGKNNSCAAASLTKDECAALSSFVLPATLPASRGNRFADDQAAVDFGYRAFFDPRFSSVPDLRCATCHQPERYFHDARPVSTAGAGAGTRNAPTVLTSAWVGHVLWDGRADSLWSQALFAVENPTEMAFTRLGLAHAIADGKLRSRYEQAFGPLPDLTSFPREGKPGDTAWDQLSAADQHVVNTIAANFGKAIEAYMRRIQTGRAPFDAFAKGDAGAISTSAAKGYALFVRSDCVSCHTGATFSDDAFHNLGPSQDPGLAEGRQVRAANPFNASGPYFDADTAKPLPLPPESPTDNGAFRTPTLRDVTRTAPYLHDGSADSLPALLQTHGSRRFNAAEQTQLLDFLFSLTGSYPEKPYSDWPAI